MAKVKAANPSSAPKKMRPPLTPEAEENQMISLAVDLARKQLQEGSASAQVITHYLKLGTTLAKLELEKTKADLELTRAKAKAVENADTSDSLYKEALKAFRGYSGQGVVRDNEEYED